MSPLVRSGTRTTPAADRQSASTNPKSVTTGNRRSALRQRAVAGARKIVAKELPGFSRQLSAMLGAGMSIVASLEALEEQTANPNFKAVIGGLRGGIEGGAAFSEALNNYPSIFDDLYVSMVRSGEMGGQLAETVARVATFLESSAKLKRKVKSAMTYPTVVFCISIALAAAMILFIVPVFAGMFEDFGGDLPAPTKFLISLSDLTRAYILYAIPALIIAGFLFRRWAKTPGGAMAVDRFKLKMPVIGPLLQKVSMSRFSRTFAQLLRSGVPILHALEIVASATGNLVVANVIHHSQKQVEGGEPLSAALKNKPVFPGLLVRMLAAGEKTGRVDEMMDSIADFYDDEIETALAGLTSMIEPFLMVFLGVVVGGILIGMFMPIFKLGEIVSQ